MPKWEPKKRAESEILPAVTSRIVEPRCNVCTHPKRDLIDRMLAMQRPYKEIQDHFEVDRRSAKNHAEKHLGFEDAAVRQIIQEEAQASEENLETGISNAMKRRVFIDIAIEKGLVSLLNNEVVVEPKDAAKLIELREKLDKEHGGVAVETVMVQFNAFKQAVLELAPPDLKWNILERTKEILDAQGAVQRVALQPGQDGAAGAPE